VIAAQRHHEQALERTEGREQAQGQLVTTAAFFSRARRNGGDHVDGRRQSFCRNWIASMRRFLAVS
jgi:hypothetical protein